MTSPVPGYSISTPYGVRGSYWGCDKDASGNGIHSGCDISAPNGAKVVAARPGRVEYVNFGSAFGNHQVAVVCDDGTRDFYAHMQSRVGTGPIGVGDKVGEVGSEGNVTGAHLHFERHKVTSGGWSCSVVVNPQPSINYQDAPKPPEDPMPKQVAASSADMNTNGEWQLVDWENTWGADSGVISAGDPGFNFSGSFVATLTATVEASNTEQGNVYSRPIEGNFGGKGGEWQVTSTHRPAETPTSGGTTHHVDTRAQALAKGDRLRFQVQGPKGAKITNLAVSILFWD